MSNKFSIADTVAAEMNTLMNSEEHKAVFAKPQAKSSAKKDDDKEDEKKEKEEAKAKKEKEDKAKEKKEKKASGDVPTPVVLQQALDGIMAVSELLEAANLEKSAALATIALKSIFAEAEEMARAGTLTTVVKIAGDCSCSSCDCKCNKKDCKCKDCDCKCGEKKDKEDKEDKDDADDVNFAKDKKDDDKDDEKEDKEEEDEKKEKEDKDDASDMNFAKEKKDDDEEDEKKEDDKEDEDDKEEDEDDANGGLAGAEGDPMAGELGAGKAIEESVGDLARQQKGTGRGGAYPQKPSTYKLPAFEEARGLEKALTYAPSSGHSTERAPVIPKVPVESKPQATPTMTKQRTEQGAQFGRGAPRKQLQIDQGTSGAPPASADDGAADDGGKSASVTPHVNAFPTDDSYANAGAVDPNKPLPERAANVLNGWFVKMAEGLEGLEDLEGLEGGHEEHEDDIDIEKLLEGAGLESEESFEEADADDVELESVASFQEYIAKTAKKKS